MEDHPTPDDFERFLQSSPQPSHAERNARVVRHLLQSCTTCRQTLVELRGGRALLSRLLELPLPGADSEVDRPVRTYNYDWAFARTARAVASSLAQGGPPKGIPERLAELAGLPEGEQIRRVRLGGRFADPELIEWLMDRIHAVRYQSPKKTLHLARLAHLASQACTPQVAGGEKPLADLQAQAWGAFGNALRICGYLPEAEEAFATAFQRCEKGSGSPLILALLLSRKSSLRMFQRNFEEAIRLSEEAGRIYRESGKMHELACTLVNKAIFLTYSGETEAAADLYCQVIPLIDREEDPQFLLVTHHNLARCYIDLDRPEEALALFVESKPLYQECQDPLILLRATWQEGLLLREIGHLRSAEAALLRARYGFMEQGLALEAAIVCLDLADVYWKLEMPEQLRQIIQEAMPIFRSKRLGREVLAALLHLRQAAGLDAHEEH